MNTTFRLMIVVAASGTFLSGCLNLTPPATPAQSHGLVLEFKSSTQVQVNGPRLQINHGKLELAGSISKQAGATTVALSHLDIVFYNATGRIVQTKPIQFTPRSVGQSRFGSRTGYFALALEPLPEGTIRIEVNAHDGDFTSPHG